MCVFVCLLACVAVCVGVCVCTSICVGVFVCVRASFDQRNQSSLPIAVAPMTPTDKEPTLARQ